jgi:LPXTG-motif cell wall-anchored protein
VGFSNPIRRAPSSLTGGGGAAPTVVWLWRPEWYQSAPEPTRRPETSGQPVIKERRDIVVSGPAPRGSNAGPWLAGVGIFGVLGGSWLVSRRRRQRMLAEL